MADYDWTKDCGCSLTGKHREFCEDNPFYAVNLIHAKYRTQGYRWNGDAYECRRGCGCLVYDPETHSNNVCLEFNPVAGE